MAVDKLPEFAKNGQQNTDGLNLEDGFPVNLKPARQWFNFLFNKLTLSINQIIDEDYIRHNEIVDNLNAKDLNKPLSANQGRILSEQKLNKDTEQSSYKTDKGFLDKYASKNTPSFFFDSGEGKFFNQFTVGVASSLDSGAYFILGASPINNKVKVMSGVRRENGTYDLQKNLTLLDSESNNVVNGDFVWDNHKNGGWARGLIYKAKSDSTTYAGFGAFGGTDTLDKIYMAIGGDNVWSNGNGKGIWIDQNGAYSNSNWTFTGEIQVGGPVYAQKFRGDGDFWFTSKDETTAKRLLSGGLLVSDGYSDANKIPNLGIYSKGLIQTATGFSSSSNEVNIFHTISRRHLYLHGEAWGCYSPQGIVPLLIENGGTGSTSLAGAKTNLQINRLAQDPSVTSMYAPTTDSRIVITDNSWGVWSINPNFNPALGTSHGGTGNTQGIAPSANKLQNARRINNAYFDGTGDIDITAARRFHGQILVKNLHLATSDGVYEVTGDGSILGLYDYGILDVYVSANVIHQTYYAHQKNSNGSVAVRQSWGGSNNFTAWRSLDPQGSWSMTKNGYKIHPDGYVEQWGYISGDKEETIKTAYFPISFPTQCLNIQVSRMSLYRTSSFTDGDGGALIVDGSITNSSFVFSQQILNSNSIGSLGGVMWRAVGY